MSSKRSKKQRRRPQPARRAYPRAQKQQGAAILVKSQPDFDRHLEQGQPVVVDFWAPWCAPCKAMAPTFDKVARAFEGQVRFLKVNTEEVPELAQAFGIRSIPTLIVLDGPTVVNSHVGLTNEATLIRMAQRALEKSQGITWTGKLRRLFSKDDAEQTVPPAAVS